VCGYGFKGLRASWGVCRYGFKGFYDRHAKPIVLTKEKVDGIHLVGGTRLGTSRGGADIKVPLPSSLCLRQDHSPLYRP
jgi:6-phosphofructokinase